MSEIQANNAGTLHTIRRHRDILNDYQKEFQKTKNILISKKNRVDLLDTADIHIV